MQKLKIDMDYLQSTMLSLLNTPSPTGYTEAASTFTCRELQRLGIDYQLTRRGAIRATLPGNVSSPDRAVVTHLDTIGAQVKKLKDNGRLRVVPVGTWSSRFAEGAEVRVFTDDGVRHGTLLPLKASGHIWGDDVDTQPVGWESLELRPDEMTRTREDLQRLGFNVGDLIAVDAQPRISENGFVKSRHLDDKAGVAAMLAAAKAVGEAGIVPPVDCHLLFTITEEVGSGASHVLHQDVAEMVAVDTAPQGGDQTSNEYAVSVGMGDATGPFDYHLTHHLLQLAKAHGINHERDLFGCYKTDAASAVEAGNDIRTALLCFGTDATHGWERTHLSSLEALAELLALYMQSEPTVKRDENQLAGLAGFPSQPVREAPHGEAQTKS